MNDHFPGRVYAKINLDAVRMNFDAMRKRLKPGVKICAVIKTDGYGHGALPIAEMAEGWEDVWGYATATAQEAFSLRDGGIKKPILILGYSFPEDYEEMAARQIRPAIFTMEMAEDFQKAAERQKVCAPVHIAVDTGMSRIGFADHAVSADLVKDIAAMPNLSIEGLFTHFARADEVDKQYARAALDRYLAFREMLSERGVVPAISHCSNSAGILEFPDANLDMVRAGITIYGIYPSDEMDRRKNTLFPVMELKSRIVHVKTVAAGVPVSYGGTYVTDRITQIATVPVGYGDGYPRSLSSRGSVLVKGKRCPIIGRVCMDQFMIDTTGMDVRTGDEVTLMGRDGEEMISVDELGTLSGRFPYEFVCDIGKRVPRIYVKLDEQR